MTDPKEPPAAITQKSTVSVALMVVIIGGIVANVSMAFSTQNKVALVQRDLEHVVDDTREIRSQITAIVTESRTEIRGLRSELSAIHTELVALTARTTKLEDQ